MTSVHIYENQNGNENTVNYIDMFQVQGEVKNEEEVYEELNLPNDNHYSNISNPDDTEQSKHEQVIQRVVGTEYQEQISECCGNSRRKRCHMTHRRRLVILSAVSLIVAGFISGAIYLPIAYIGRSENSDLITGFNVTCKSNLITDFNDTCNSALITNTTSITSIKHYKTDQKLTNEQRCRRRRRYQNNTFNTMDKLKRIIKTGLLNLGIKGYEKDYSVLRYIRNLFWVSGQNLFGQNSVYIYDVNKSTGYTPEAKTIGFNHKENPLIIRLDQLHTGEIIILVKIKVQTIFKSDTRELNWEEFMVGKKESRIDDIFVHGCQFSVIDCINSKLKTWTLKGSESIWKIGGTLKLSGHSIGDKCNFLLNPDFIFVGNDLNNNPKLLQYSKDGKFMRDYGFESYPKLCAVSPNGAVVIHHNQHQMKIFSSTLFKVVETYRWGKIGRINDILIGDDMNIWVLANQRKGVRPLQLYKFTRIKFVRE